MLPDDAWIDRVTQTACHHVAEGYSQDQAIDMCNGDARRDAG